MREVATQLPDAPPLLIHKNNSDGKGNSYGTHENYLVDRQTAFADIVRDLTPFFVSRQVFCGAGKLGSEGVLGRARAAITSSRSAQTSSRPRWAWRRP